MHETIYTLPSCPVTIALLSDLHNRPYDPVIISLRKHSPDLVCITGDVLYGSQPEGNDLIVEKQKNVLPFLEACAVLAPTYLSLGNHEWMLSAEDMDKLAATEVTALDNSWSATEISGKRLIIGGLSSGYVMDYRRFVAYLDTEERACRYPRKDDLSGIAGASTVSHHIPDVSWLPIFTEQPGYHILLSHHPEYWPLIAPHPIDLCLAGHAHGGQWRIFNHGVWAPGQGLWPKWSRGVYENRLIVSAGLSNTTWIPRLWNPTEVVYINCD